MNQGITSRSVVLGTVVFLGLIAMSVVLGSIVLVAMSKPSLPGSIEAMGAAAGGALAGILASTRSTVPASEQAPVSQVGPTSADFQTPG